MDNIGGVSGSRPSYYSPQEPQNKNKEETEIFLHRIDGWLANHPKGSAQYHFAQEVKEVLQQVINTGKFDLPLEHIFQTQIYGKDFDTNGEGKDIYMRYPGLNEEHVKQLVSLINDDEVAIHVPEKTQMDKIYEKLTTVYLNGTDYIRAEGNDRKLMQMLQYYLEDRGSKDTHLGELKEWATLMTTKEVYQKPQWGSTPMYFNELTGIDPK